MNKKHFSLLCIGSLVLFNISSYAADNFEDGLALFYMRPLSALDMFEFKPGHMPVYDSKQFLDPRKKKAEEHLTKNNKPTVPNKDEKGNPIYWSLECIKNLAGASNSQDRQLIAKLYYIHSKQSAYKNEARDILASAMNNNGSFDELIDPFGAQQPKADGNNIVFTDESAWPLWFRIAMYLDDYKEIMEALLLQKPDIINCQFLTGPSRTNLGSFMLHRHKNKQLNWSLEELIAKIILS